MIIIGPFPPPVHGAANITSRVAELVEEEGVEVQRCNVAPLPNSSPLLRHASRFARYVRAWWRLLRTSPVEPVYLSLSGGLGQLYDLVCIVLVRLARRQLFIHHHSFNYLSRKRALASACFAAAGAHAVHFALCKRMGGLIKQTYGANTKILTVSNLSLGDFAEFAPPPMERTFRRIGFLSSLSFDKGLDSIASLSRLLAPYGIETLVAGDARTQAVSSFIAKEVTENSHFKYVGPVYGAEKIAFYHSIDLFVFLSRYKNEAEPLVIYEAASAHLPVAGTDIGCVGEMLGDPFMLLERADEREIAKLAERIVSILDDPAELHRLKQHARQSYLARKNSVEDERSRFLSVLLGAARQECHARI